ncbi:hypothetical protein Cgig2_015516 [Carnegiea gigantea]|uniref:Uncharacterized protein n=1 Tax=Carnegiea gigantea TaxID=171969 RepID=A0A9Q1JTE8_9CARY|nr:hypothetical protein Cgig2_015516 [Carnegiea gigantea]
MEKHIVLCLLLSLVTSSFSQDVIRPKPLRPNSQITVIGTVYCDICSNNTFSRQSYFLPGVEVKVDCKFKATAPETSEEITFSVNRTTNRFGWYKLEIPAVDGIECAEESAVVSSCRASLAGSSSSSSKCNVPGYKTTSDVVYFKSREANICIYGLSALNFRPRRKNKALCAN